MNIRKSKNLAEASDYISPGDTLRSKIYPDQTFKISTILRYQEGLYKGSIDGIEVKDQYGLSRLILYKHFNNFILVS